MEERPFLCRLKSSGPGSRKAKALGTPEGLAASHSGTRKYLATRDDESQQFQLRPDIAFIDDYGVPQMIADAKWKLLNEQIENQAFPVATCISFMPMQVVIKLIICS